MNILIAADIFPPASGGPATYSSNLLRELPKQGHTVKVVTHIHEKLENEPANVFRVKNSSFLQRYFGYFRLLEKHTKDVDVIYAMGPVNAGLPAFLVSKILNKKLVCKVVGDYAWEQGVARFGVKELPDEFQYKKYGWRVELIRKIEKYICKKADHVIVPSEYLKKIVKGWGVLQDRITVVYNAPTEHLNTHSANIFCNKFKNKKIIFTAGRLMPWKGVSALVELMPELLKKESTAHLVIAGDGPERKNLEAKINNLELENNVSLLGKIASSEMQELFKQSVMFILNSGYEGMPHVVLEAFEAGCPVAVSNEGGNSEVVEDKKTGLLFKYNDKESISNAINLLLNDIELKNKCIIGGKEKVAQLSQKKMLEHTISVLKSL
jgi:glycosyltransferase involved in cell wall biosynthesis